jgi:hypothetical protein
MIRDISNSTLGGHGSHLKSIEGPGYYTLVLVTFYFWMDTEKNEATAVERAWQPLFY